MSVTLLMISHEGVGNALLKTLKTTFADHLPLNVSTVDIQPDSEPETIIKRLKNILKELDHGDGVLILSDMFGATPYNIAHTLKDYPKVKLISGMNLPMLIRIMNYPHLNLEELAQKAIEGGRSGIIDCDNKECQ